LRHLALEQLPIGTNHSVVKPPGTPRLLEILLACWL